MQIIRRNMTFSTALEELKVGRCVCREGWNGKGMYVKKVLLHDISLGDQNPGNYFQQGCLAIKTADNQLQLGWLPSQQDLMSNDWCLVDAEGQEFDSYGYRYEETFKICIHGNAEGIRGDRFDSAVVLGMATAIQEAVEKEITEGTPKLFVEVQSCQ